MLKLRAACEATSAHGLSRLVSSKPVFIRVAWLLLFLLFLGFFLRGLVGFVDKLQSRQVTSSLEAGTVRFQFPDVYACFENPVSGTYSVKMNDSVIQQLNSSLNETSLLLENLARSLFQNKSMMTGAEMAAEIERTKRIYSHFYVSSLPYRLVVDAIAQRKEQSILYSGVFKLNELGMYTRIEVPSTAFHHPTLLRCFGWSVNTVPVLKTLESRNSLVVTLFVDDYDGASIPSLNGNSVKSPVYASYQPASGSDLVWLNVPVTDWSLVAANSVSQDRQSGVRVFLMSPGEYPSDFGSSFLLAPGKHHVVEVSMREEVRDADQFDCTSNADRVQFLNPYDQTRYIHNYSYSYCYFDEYNKKSLAESKYLAPDIPITWDARDGKNFFNLTGQRENLAQRIAGGALSGSTNLDEVASSICKSHAPCSNFIYDTQISSASWPMLASLSTFLSTTVAKARDKAGRNGLSVPGLDFLVNASSGNASISAAAVAFANANLLKLEIRPRRMDCDKLKFSIDYGFENFVADIGGIMGIYLGMSLLTICELFDLIAELLYLRLCSPGSRQSGRVAADETGAGQVQLPPTENSGSAVSIVPLGADKQQE